MTSWASCRHFKKFLKNYSESALEKTLINNFSDLQLFSSWRGEQNVLAPVLSVIFLIIIDSDWHIYIYIYIYIYIIYIFSGKKRTLSPNLVGKKKHSQRFSSKNGPETRRILLKFSGKLLLSPTQLLYNFEATTSTILKDITKYRFSLL